MMKSICVKKPHELLIEERPMPVLANPDEVLVKVKLGGICGSDLHVYHGTSPVATYPRVLGHEIVGEVFETGAAVTGLKKGDRVVMDPVINCGTCYQCRIGRQNVCSSLKVRSAHVDGGYQEYILVPEKSLHLLPDSLSWEEAVLIEPFTIAEQSCSRAGVQADDKVFIMGAGPIGLSILKRARLTGATCFVTDIVESRLQMARAYGAQATINASTQHVEEELLRLTDGVKPTVIIDAVCNVKSFEDAVKLVAAAGRVVTLGFSPQPSAIAQVLITAKELDVRGSRLHNNKFPVVIDLLKSGRLDVKGMVTHQFPFEQVQEAIKLIEDAGQEKGKVVLRF